MDGHTVQLMDNFLDFLNDLKLDGSIPWTDKKSTMRAILLLKTSLFYCNADWNGVDDATERLELRAICCKLRTYFSMLNGDIWRVFECDDPTQLAVPLFCCSMRIGLYRIKVGEFYDHVRKLPHPHPGVICKWHMFDDFAASVQKYLMNVPMEPLGWGSAFEYSAVVANYEATAQNLELFRSFVSSFSKQVSSFSKQLFIYDYNKVRSLLGRASAIVLSILHMACTNDVHQIVSAEMEENIYRSSDDMSRKLLPHHPDVMELYLEVLSASVEIIKASKPPVPPVHSVVNSFHNLLYSALDQAHILGEILHLPIMDLLVGSQVDMMLVQGLTVVAREAGSLFSSTSNHAVVSNLLHKLNHIKEQLFILELHNYKVSLTSNGEDQSAMIRKAFRCLSQLFGTPKEFISRLLKTPKVRMEAIEELILDLIESTLKETGSLCDSRQTKPFSAVMIQKSKFPIFKLLRAQAIISVLADSSTSCLKFLGDFQIDNHKAPHDSTNCGTSASNAASSITLLLNKFHDFLDHRLRSSVQRIHSRSARRAIKFVKTFLLYFDANWSGLDEAEHFAYLQCEGTKTYFRWLECEIAKVFECKYRRHRDSAILQAFVTVDLLRINIEEIYDEIARVPHPTLFVDGVVFDKFADSVQQYLMDNPKRPIGCEPADYRSAFNSYKVTVERLKLFRCLVSSFSKQCTDQKKLQALLDRSAAMVFCILHMAHANSVNHAHGGEVEENFHSSSYDMQRRLSPQNQDAMEVYFDILSANVKIIEVSKQSSGPVHSINESFLNLLQSAKTQVHIICHILDIAMVDLIVDKRDECKDHLEILLNQGYATIARETESIRSSFPPNHTVLSNLLQDLNLIRSELFVLELLNNEASLVSITDTFLSLSIFFKTPVLPMDDTGKLILSLIETLVREAGSLCGSHQTRSFSKDAILESSLAIFQVLKAETILMFHRHNTSSFDLLQRFLTETLKRGVMISREMLSGTPYDKLKDGDARTIRQVFSSSVILSNRKSMEVSVIVLLDKFHDFLNASDNEAYKRTDWLNSSVHWTDKMSAMRSIKFIKTFMFYYSADWSGMDEASHIASQFEQMRTYFRLLGPEISKVLECDNLASALTKSVILISILRCGVEKVYDKLMKLSHPTLFIDGLVFDEYADSVQQYLMNVPKEPRGWGRSPHKYSEVKQNYKLTVQKLARFRHFVLSFSNQCTDQKKLQSLLARSVVLVSNILCRAYINDVYETDTAEMEERIFASSSDMSQKLSPENQGAMAVYLGVLSANVEIVKQPTSMAESFVSLLWSAQNQADILDCILDYPVLDFMVDEWDEQGYALLAREAGSLTSFMLNHVVLRSLVHKLSLIKGVLFVLELHNHKASFSIGENRSADIKEVFRCLTHFFKRPVVQMEHVDKFLLSLIEAFLGEMGWLTENFSEAKIVGSSLTIYKLFKIEALLVLLSHNTSSLKVLAEFPIKMLQKTLIFLRDSLPGPTNDNLKHENILTVFETMVSKEAYLVCSSGDSNRELDQPMQISQLPWLLFNTYPKGDGVVFSEHLLGRLRKYMSNEPDTCVFLTEQIDSFLHDVEFFLSFLKDVKRVDSKNKDLGLQMTCLIYNAEYIIDMFMLGEVPSCFIHLVLFIAIEETKFIKGKIQDNWHDGESFELPHQDVQLSLTSEGSNLRAEEVIVGFDDQARVITDQLQTGSKRLQVVSIVGMAGIGKTTLTKKVYSSFCIQHHFAVCARCYVSHVYKKRELLLEILGDLANVTDDDIEKKDDDDLALLIKQKLKGKRYLVVVDDVWSIEHWDDLKLSFPDDNKGSRILFTTRNHAVAREAGPEIEPYVLHFLSHLQSWELLQAKLFRGGQCPEHLLEAGRLVAENCRGLPLAIVVIAGILKRMQMNKLQWEEIAKHLRSRVTDDEERQFMGMLELSYIHLPSYLKPCFLYLGSFLEDQVIPVKKLQWLWISEGFIPKKNPKSLEETAMKFVEELMKRSLVMEAKRSSLGVTKTIRIHDMLRDLCLKKAKEENFMQLISMNDSNSLDSHVGKEYRLCVHSSKQLFIQLRPSPSNVHSLLFFATDNNQDNKSYDISSIFQDFKLVRVLDLESIAASIFPTGTDLLLCLSYLAIKGNIKSVPSSISKLWNLETLIVKGTRGEIALPSSLWSMEMLRHVHVRPQATLTLSSPELENAKVLVNLTTCSSPVFPDSEAAEKILKRWINLRKLRCIFMQHWDSSRDCSVFPSLELLCKLESLNIYNGGRTLPADMTFPSNLKKLTLYRFCFPWDHISVISQLSNLVVLKLLFRAFDGDTWEMKGESFPRLRALKLENLNLANWHNSLDCLDHFPELERLVLRNCKKLGEIPSSFGELPTLQMIEVNWCTPSAAKSMETIMDQQLDYGNQDFHVMITPSEWDFRLFS